MLNRSLLISCFILLFTFSYGQELISDIDNPRQFYSFSSRGFTEFEGKEYLLNRGELGTEVSIVEDGEINFLHTMSHRPLDGDPLYISDYRYNNSRFIVDGDRLLEVYNFSIFILNFVSGELIKHVDLCEYDIKLLNNKIETFDSRILFKGLHLDEEAFFLYDISTDEIEKLEWTVGKNIYQTDHWLYSFNDSSTELSGFNTKTGEIDFTYIFDEGIQTVSIKNNLLQQHLNIIFESNSIIEIHGSEIIYDSDCFANQNVKIADTYFRNGVLYASILTDGTYELVAIILESCNSVIDFENLTFAKSPTFLDNKALDIRYLMFSVTDGFEDTGEHYIIDIEETSITNLDIPIFFLYWNISLVVDNMLYIFGGGFNNDGGIIFRFYGVNLDDKSSFTLPILTDNNIVSKIGELAKDNAISFLTYSKDIGTQVLKYSTLSNTTEVIVQGLDFNNQGVGVVRNMINVNNKYYYNDNSGVYVIEGNNVKKIIDGDASMPIVDNDNIVSGVIIDDELLYSFNINAEDDTWDSIIIEGITTTNYNFDFPATKNVIFCFHENQDYHFNGYIDLFSREFSPLLDGSRHSSVLATSGDNAVIYYDEFWEFTYSFNTKTKEHTLISSFLKRITKAVGDGLGGFYIFSEGTFSSVAESQEIIHVNSDGEEVEKIDIEYTKPYNSIDFLYDNGNIVCPLPANDTVNVFMVQDNQHKIRSIPHENKFYYDNIFMETNEDKTLIESKFGDVFKAYYFSFDQDPVDLSNGGVPDRIIEVVISEDKIALFYYKEDANKLGIEIFDLETFDKIGDEEYDISKEDYQQINLFGKLNENTSILSFNNGENGYEVYTFNIEDGRFELLYDISEGFLDSWPMNHTQIGNYQYLTAVGEDRSRQWYRFNNDSIIEDNTNDESISLFPNPATDFINLSTNLISFEISDVKGNILHLEKSKNSKSVDVSYFPSGFYTINGVDEEGNKRSGSFIIQN